MTPPEVTPRQREIWRRLAEAEPAKQIADRLGISYSTVCSHREALYRKLTPCNNPVTLARLAIRWGVVSEPVLVQPTVGNGGVTPV